jgi:uncharacterized protein YbjT (DUF2867 family)
MSDDGIFILGATRASGLEIARLLRSRGDPVTALVREGSPHDELDAIGATIVTGDALDRKSLDAAFEGKNFCAIIASLGGPPHDNRKVDLDGNVNAVDAARAAGVKRFIMLTAIGCGDSWDALPPLGQKYLGTTIKLKTGAEDHLKASSLDYSIIRPGALTDEPATGNGLLNEDPSLIGTINRTDVALLTVQCLDDDATIGKAYSVMDKDLVGITPVTHPDRFGGQPFPDRAPN